MASNDILSIRFMMAVVEKIPIPRTYMGGEFLPFEEATSAELTWDVLKAEQNLAGLYSIDGHIQPGHDAIFGQMFADVCRVGASRIVSEDEYRKLRDPGMLGVETGLVADLRAEAERKIARKLGDCNREVDAAIEYLRMNALMGYISWPPAGMATVPALGNAVMSIDYNFPSDHRVRADNTTVFGSGAALWSDATAGDPVHTLQIIAEKIEDDAGVSADALDIIGSRRAFRLASETSKFRDRVQYTDVKGLLTVGDFTKYISDQVGVNCRVYNGQYTYRSVSTSDPSDITIKRKRILPTNQLIVIPRGTKVGDTATSPSQANNWRPGKFTWRKDETNPWRTEIGVGINAFPRITNTDCVFVLTVEADPVGLKDKK